MTFPSTEGNVKDKHETEATELVAKQAGLSRATFERATKVIEKGTDEQKAELAQPLLSIERELAKRRRLATLKQGDEIPLPPNGGDGEKGEAAKSVAKQAGLSTRTFERATKVIEKGTDEQKEKLRNGKAEICAVYGEIRRAERKAGQFLQELAKRREIGGVAPVGATGKASELVAKQGVAGGKARQGSASDKLSFAKVAASTYSGAKK